MFIRHLSLTNFRLYARLELDLSRGLVVIQGDNAQGKTSLLEAIYFLATSHALHTPVDRQVIRWGAEEEGLYPFAVLKALIQSNAGLRLIEIGMQSMASGRLRKEIRVDGLPKRAIDLVGQLNVVLFFPADVELVAGPPALRRAFLDAALSQLDADYVRALERYARALANRNALLKQAQERPLDPDELALWDDQLVPAGVEVALRRRRAVSALARLAAPIHRELSNGREYLEIVYQPNFDPLRPAALDTSYQISLDDAALPAGVAYDDLLAAFRRALAERRREEIARGMTLVGPHRDELRFLANGLDLGEYGSRGQQRTAVLALKLAQAQWMREHTGEDPVLLLDEVLAELDAYRRRCLLRFIERANQVIITTTDLQRLDQALLTQAMFLRVCAGVISPMA
jgi:DNA replication and repair protein RecF